MAGLLDPQSSSYCQAKQSASRVVTEAKTWVWSEFSEPMEQDFQSTPKKFWQTIQQVRRKNWDPVHMVFGVEREWLTLAESIVQQWMEYFKDLFNPTNAHSRAGRLWPGLFHHCDSGRTRGG